MRSPPAKGSKSFLKWVWKYAICIIKHHTDCILSCSIQKDPFTCGLLTWCKNLTTHLIHFLEFLCSMPLLIIYNTFLLDPLLSYPITLKLYFDKWSVNLSVTLNILTHHSCKMNTSKYNYLDLFFCEDITSFQYTEIRNIFFSKSNEDHFQFSNKKVFQ